MDWKPFIQQGSAYHDFLQEFGQAHHRQRWQAGYEQIRLREEQLVVLKSFARPMKVLCLAGAWCGDCVKQCPILQRFAEATDTIDLRFLDRDAHPQATRELSINAGQRVPVVVFCAEDGHECGRFGDRTLSRYRELAANLTGAACPTGLDAGNDSLLNAVTAEWLNEFERIQLMLRLSPRLRRAHGD